MGKNKELRALITLAGKVDPSLQAAMLKASNESAKCSTGMGKGFTNVFSGIKSMGLGALKMLGSALIGLTVAGAVAFGAMGVQGLQYASDLTEVQNVVDVTFGANAEAINSFAETAKEAYGLSKLQAKEYSGTLGTMLKSMGLTGDETLVMSQNLTALAGDMASFRNLAPEEAFEKIRAGISGETEPLKQLGINMSVANLQAYAMSQGITESYNSMSQAEQALLRYNYLLGATKDMQGDFGRTELTFANQQRQLKVNLQEVSGEIMQAMMPALTSCMIQVNQFLQNLDTQAIGEFVGSLGEMAMAFLPMVMDLMPLFGDLLMLILPPLIELGQVLIPIVAQVLGAMMEALGPVMPVLIDIARVLLPPIAEILTAIMPLVSGLASLISGTLSVAINIFVKVLEPMIAGLKWIAELLGSVGRAAGDFLSGKVSTAVAEAQGGGTSGRRLEEYALGGFADKPSIFGEEGLEVAIPIRPGWERSKALLRRTARLLGMGDTVETHSTNEERYSFTYAPVYQISGGQGELEPLVKNQYRQFKSMMEEFLARKGRYAW